MRQPYLTSFALLICIYGEAAIGLILPLKPIQTVQADVLQLRAPSLIAAVPSGSAASRNGWSITTDGEQDIDPASNALDGNTNTIYHSHYKPNALPLPHRITVDMQSVLNVSGITYLPRQDGNGNGNIGQHEIYTSTDGIHFGDPVAFGTWYDDSTMKLAAWETKRARYIKIVAITEAGGRGRKCQVLRFVVLFRSLFSANLSGFRNSLADHVP
jgi:galactose oxidase